MTHLKVIVLCRLLGKYKIFKDLIQTVSFTVCSGDIKKSSENDQLTGHFQSFFFRPPTLNLKRNVNQLIKKSLTKILDIP